MDIFNNTTKVVKDDLTKKIKAGSKVAIAAASFLSMRIKRSRMN